MLEDGGDECEDMRPSTCIVYNSDRCGVNHFSSPLYFQMHHPIQMKPADSEKTSGKWMHV